MQFYHPQAIHSIIQLFSAGGRCLYRIFLNGSFKDLEYACCPVKAHVTNDHMSEFRHFIYEFGNITYILFIEEFTHFHELIRFEQFQKPFSNMKLFWIQTHAQIYRSLVKSQEARGKGQEAKGKEQEVKGKRQ